MNENNRKISKLYFSRLSMPYLLKFRNQNKNLRKIVSSAMLNRLLTVEKDRVDIPLIEFISKINALEVEFRYKHPKNEEEEFEFVDSKISDELMESFVSADFSRTGCNVEMLDRFSTVTLRKLSIDWIKVGDEEMNKIAEFTGLEELSLGDNIEAKSGLNGLTRLKNLKSLCLKDNSRNTKLIEALTKLHPLERLEIKVPMVKKGEISQLNTISASQLMIEGQRIEQPEGKIDFSGFKELEIKLGGVHTLSLDLSTLEGNLNILNLTELRVDDAVCTQISKFSALTRLNLAKNMITEEGIYSFESLKDLVVLDISHNNIENLPSSLEICTKIRVFDCSFNPIKNKSLDVLSKMPKLAVLSLENTDLSDGSGVKLSSFPRLKTLNVVKSNFGPRDLNGILASTSLKSLSIEKSPIDPATLSHFNAKSIDLIQVEEPEPEEEKPEEEKEEKE